MCNCNFFFLFSIKWYGTKYEICALIGWVTEASRMTHDRKMVNFYQLLYSKNIWMFMKKKIPFNLRIPTYSSLNLIFINNQNWLNNDHKYYVLHFTFRSIIIILKCWIRNIIIVSSTTTKPICYLESRLSIQPAIASITYSSYLCSNYIIIIDVYIFRLVYIHQRSVITYIYEVCYVIFNHDIIESLWYHGFKKQ